MSACGRRFDSGADTELPVGGDPPRDAAEEMRGEMGDANPGQDEEAALVGDFVHVRPAHRR